MATKLTKFVMPYPLNVVVRFRGLSRHKTVPREESANDPKRTFLMLS